MLLEGELITQAKTQAKAVIEKETVRLTDLFYWLCHLLLVGNLPFVIIRENQSKAVSL